MSYVEDAEYSSQALTTYTVRVLHCLRYIHKYSVRRRDCVVIPESLRWCSSMTSLVSFFSSGSVKYCTSNGRNTCIFNDISITYIMVPCLLYYVYIILFCRSNFRISRKCFCMQYVDFKAHILIVGQSKKTTSIVHLENLALQCRIK